MEHNISLISTLAAGFGIALVLGFVAERIKMPALVGYLLAGIIIGPNTPGFVADVQLAAQLSEIGVMLLMFGVGLHFSLRDLLAVRRIAIPGAIVQMAFATVLGALLAFYAWGWPWGQALVFGVTLSCASTVVLLKAIEARGALDTMNGRIAVGWLVVEDLATVLVLVLLPPLASVLGGANQAPAAASDVPIWVTLGVTLLQVAGFVALMLVAGSRLIPWVLWHVSRTGSRELFTLAVIAAAIGIAFGAAQLFSVSFALGAFFAGMVMRESEFAHRAAQESLPFRDAFSVLFFVAVGMLFEPAVLMLEPIKVLTVVLIIVVGKGLASLLLVLAFRYPLNTALTVSASLAQIGEFSFILAGLSVALGLLPAEGMSLILAAALISIALNPLLFAMVEPVRRWFLARSDIARALEIRVDPYAELPTDTARRYLEGQVVIVGFGRVGRRIADALVERDIPYVVVEQRREVVEALRRKGVPAVSGNATDAAVLIQAHIANAAMMVVATPDLMDIRATVEIARTLNPDIELVLRTHSESESVLLRQEGVGAVFFGEEELARGMAGYVLGRFFPGMTHPVPVPD
ncbi:cation:proton antiporter domain-containing protein [Nitrogeniibacter aestuarii]|uniref:cation:proton antiporter domain-containing protein n=1 Tax=Nitrogeniibacter aestuarii TaxID=2815343 RepID=UPI001D0FD6F5|nr:cation:proton antiporter [Nitrogeniibacter aestuarii]